MIEAKRGTEWVLRFQDGEDLMDRLRGIASDSALILLGIGMVRDAELGYWDGTEYQIRRCVAPCELIALQGNLARDASGAQVAHVHVSLAREDGTVIGGHLVRAIVHNTVEMALRPLQDVVLERKAESSGLVGLFPRAT